MFLIHLKLGLKLLPQDVVSHFYNALLMPTISNMSITWHGSAIFQAVVKHFHNSLEDAVPLLKIH